MRLPDIDYEGPIAPLAPDLVPDVERGTAGGTSLPFALPTSWFDKTPARPPQEEKILDRLLGSASSSNDACGCLPKLSFEDRVLGFVACFCIGLALSFSCFLSFGSVLHGNFSPWALKYSLGNVLALCSTGFLVGPTAQLNKMNSPVRRGTSAVYLGSIVLTLFAAMVLRASFFTLLCMLLQFCALFWYCLSYIPWGRRLFTRCAFGC